VNLTGQVPVLAGADQVAYLDIDDTIKATYGYQKEGAGYGYSKVKGLGALFGIISTPLSAPLIAAARLRKGSTNSAKGACRLVADALATVKRAGVTGGITMRADSAYYNHDVIAAARRCGARFWRHRPHGQGRDQDDQPDPRGRLGGHQVPTRDLRRGRAAVGVRRPGRRDHLHGVHVAPQERAHHSPG
ncbi:MAG: transposase, partial [Actinomycetales bacterium]|nr:transposase [Actinomycetales bacterium]